MKIDRTKLSAEDWIYLYTMRDIEKKVQDISFKNAYEEFMFEEYLIAKFIQPERLNPETLKKDVIV